MKKWRFGGYFMLWEVKIMRFRVFLIGLDGKGYKYCSEDLKSTSKRWSGVFGSEKSVWKCCKFVKNKSILK